jgi:hypothetical protein
MSTAIRWARLRLATAATGAALFAVSASFAQSPALGEVAAGALPTEHGLPTRPPRQLPPGPSANSQPSEHPLLPVLRWAERGLPAIEKLKDYSATLVRRERIRGKLTSREYIFIKIRHEPFSVYARFQGPASVKGQEVIYVVGRNQGRMWAHKPSIPFTASLYPDGLIAMNNRRYPLTEIGLVNLVRRLVEVGKDDVKHGECEVTYFTGAKVNSRVCTAIQVVHPAPRDIFRFHAALIFVDDELKVPIHYESYDWPSDSGGEPRLIEEYTYLDLKLNNGFTDQDFSTQNPQYDFPPATKEPGQEARSK